MGDEVGGERKYVKIMERVGASEKRCGEKMGKEKKIPKPRNETKEKKAMRSTNTGNMYCSYRQCLQYSTGYTQVYILSYSCSSCW